MRISRPTMASKGARLAALAGLLASFLLTSSGPSEAASTSSGLTPNTGGALSTQVLSLAGKDFADAAGTSQVLPLASHGVTFASATCATEATASQTDAAAVAIASAVRLVITTPSTLADTVTNGLEAKKDYNLCVYSASTSKLLATAKYTVYPKPTLATNFLSLTGGPTSGGQAITVIGDKTPGSTATLSGYFSSKTTATLGGVALTSIKVAKDGNTFTAVTPPLPIGLADLVVTTEGGSITKTDAYTASAAIVVSPTLILPAGGTIITIKGKGFTAIKDTLGIAFYAGAYNPSLVCTDMQVVSDTELVCTTPAVDPGAYNVMVTDDLGSGPAAAYASVVSSGATVTAGSF